jgi:RNA polymerase sigma factor (sigma-70 family)
VETPAATRPVGRSIRFLATSRERIMALNTDDPLPPADWVEATEPTTDFASLYRSESGRLTRYFARRVAAHDVVDMVQETFRKMMGAASDRKLSFDNPQAYLTRIADNLVRHRARSMSQRAADMSEPVDEQHLSGPDPVHALEQRELLRLVDAAIATMKPRTREIFLLHRSDGLSYAEIAEAMGMGVTGVEKQMIKALSHIRRRVDRR